MVRAWYPDDRSVMRVTSTGHLMSADGMAVDVFADPSGVLLADILDAAATPIAGSRLAVGGASMPRFLGPDGRTNALYGRIVGTADFFPMDPMSAPTSAQGAGHAHVQATPTASWLIAHGLGYDPGGITVRDAGGAVIIGGTVIYGTSGAALSIGFDLPLAGTATLS
jgi:hypothetical protein